MNYTPEQKTEALQLYAEHGRNEAARQTGIPSGTIASWASRNDVHGPMPEEVAKRSATAVAGVAGRKAQLASNLLDDIERIRTQLFAPVVEKKAMTVSQGHTLGSQIEIAEVELNRPTAGDQKLMMTAIAIGVDKVLLLLGEATERIEQLDRGADPGVQRGRALEHVDELAARRTA